MRLLYLPNHAVLEFDELRILSEFAGSIFSAWFYADPEHPTASVRPPLPNVPLNERAAEIWRRESLTRENCLHSQDFVESFDAVIAVSDRNSLDYFTCIEHLPVIVRTIGQSTPTCESELRKHRSKFFIVRYSPLERFIPGYAGGDAQIRFGKYPEDFKAWVGDNGHVTTLYSNMQRRMDHASFAAYKSITEPFPRAMYGEGNPDGPWTRKGLSYGEMLDMFSRASVYYCCHTIPASYTLNLIEAMMTGCPIITPGRSLIAHVKRSGWDTSQAYEAPDFLNADDFTACAEDIESGQAALAVLLADRDLAQRVSQRNRLKAIELFGARQIAAEWKATLDSLV